MKRFKKQRRGKKYVRRNHKTKRRSFTSRVKKVVGRMSELKYIEKTVGNT